MDSQAFAIALDRLKFYAKDAALSFSQASARFDAFGIANGSSVSANRKCLPVYIMLRLTMKRRNPQNQW